jgi:hypothetical protein
MQQIKIFKGQEYELPTLESAVNKWLADSGARVIHVFGNLAPRGPATDPNAGTISPGPFIPSEVLLVMLYEKA